MKDFSGLYVITDENLINQKNYFDIINSVLIHKPTFIQLRIKGLSKEEVLYKAKRIRELSLKYDVKFIINDNVEVAIESGADGVHIGKFDEDFNKVREFRNYEKKDNWYLWKIPVEFLAHTNDIHKCITRYDIKGVYK